MSIIKNAFKAVDSYLTPSENREKVLVAAVMLVAIAAIVRR